MSEPFREFPSNEIEELDTPPQKSGGLRPYFRIFWRKAWLIAGITSLTTFAAWLNSSLDSYTYTGNFYLLVEPITSAGKLSDPTTLTRTGGVPNENLFALDYPTNLAFLQSPGMTFRIAQDVHEKVLTRSVPAIWKDLRENLAVSRVIIGSEDTKIFQVTYTGENPKEVQSTLETAAKTFVKYSAEDRETSIKAGVKFIDQQLPELQTKLAQLKTKQQKLRQQYKLVDPIAKNQQLLSQSQNLADQQLAIQGQLKSLKTLQNLLQRQLQLSPEEALAAASLNQDPNRLSLLARLQDIETQLALAGATFTLDSPQMQGLQEQRQNIQTLLDQRTQQLISQNSLFITKNSPVLKFQDPTRLRLIEQLVATSNQVLTLEAQNQSLEAARKSSEEQAKKLPAIANQYSGIEREIQLNQQIIDRFLTQRENLKVEAAQDLPWQLISQPQIPLDAEGKPIGEPPSRTKKILAGLGSGLLLGMGLAILLEKRRDIFYNSTDLSQAFSLPVIGEIPQVEPPSSVASIEPEGEQQSPQPRHQQSQETDALFLNAFDSLYTQLCFLDRNPPVSSLVVTSAESGAGQSTVALYLAKTAAIAGKKVLLVDANWHDPKLHEWLELPNHKGLRHLLSDRVLAEDIILPVPSFENLSLLTPGAPYLDEAIRFWSPQMQKLMAQLQAKYDLVIYDPPNFFQAADISFLASQSDGLLIVVGLKKTRQSLNKKMIQQIQQFNLPILGIVANYL